MTNRLQFVVPGIPRPGGSKRAIRHKHTGRIVVLKAGGPLEEQWRAVVSTVAAKAMAESRTQMIGGPVFLSVVYTLPRPKCHYRKDGTLKPSAPRYHTTKPDRGKLDRALEDSLTGIVYRDDRQIVESHSRKEYGDTPGAKVQLWEEPERPAKATPTHNAACFSCGGRGRVYLQPDDDPRNDGWYSCPECNLPLSRQEMEAREICGQGK